MKVLVVFALALATASAGLTREVPIQPREVLVQPREVPIEAWEVPIEAWEVPIEAWEVPIQPREVPIQPREVPIEAWKVPIKSLKPPIMPIEVPIQPWEVPIQPREVPIQPREVPIEAWKVPIMPIEVPIQPRDMPEQPSIEGRITNGKTATQGQFPYQVGLAFESSSGGWWCGGSIIDKSWVLTAAHCTSGASSVTIYYGATVRTNAKVTLKELSSNFIQHASYNSVVLRNDISLIKTSAVSFSSDINKIALPAIASSYSTYAGEKAIASGWGKTSDSASAVSNTLQYQTFNVVSVATCQSTYGSLIASSNVICVATPNKSSTCNGDSGGPLVLSNEKVLIGVTSFVSGSGCESGAPAGFTRVTSYLEWIKEKSGVTK